MNLQKNKHNTSNEQKDFWESLQLDIITSNQKLTIEGLYTYIERDIMFSIFFRGLTPIEITAFQEIYGIKEFGYVILLELHERVRTNLPGLSIDDMALHYSIKKAIPKKSCTIGPMISNRICILVGSDSDIAQQQHKEESTNLAKELINKLEKEFNISVKAGIGRVFSIYSIYNSFIDTLACLYYSNPNDLTHYCDLKQLTEDTSFDYYETEKHLLEAIRLRKPEAYDYFGIILNWIKPLSDYAKRSRILELLVLSNHAMRMDSQADAKYINYSTYIDDFMKLKGEQLIEFALKSFIYITSYVKPQTTIDYKNHIVKTTKEYLEKHYMEDISLEDMASQVNISPQYFSKLIKKTTGFNFIDWLSMLRVRKAKELLTNSSLTVKEVCFMVGYKDPNYFSRIFKKRIGITPSEYVKASSFINNKN